MLKNRYRIIELDLMVYSILFFLSTGCQFFMNKGTIKSAVSTKTIECPDQFVEVPAREPYTTSSYCVAKFEMKIRGLVDGNVAYSDTNSAVSSGFGTPWVNINRAQAIVECQKLGAGYDLISNAEWQALAQDAELVASNWTSGAVGVEMMYQGHSDGSPSDGLSVTDVSDKYNQTGNNANQTPLGSGVEQRRTLNLSTGGEIWDANGNDWEWVKDDNSIIYGADDYWTAITGTPKELFGPVGTYTGTSNSRYAGLGYGWINRDNGGVLRGGGTYSFGDKAGVFFIYLGFPPTATGNFIGFRCSFHP